MAASSAIKAKRVAQGRKAGALAGAVAKKELDNVRLSVRGKALSLRPAQRLGFVKENPKMRGTVCFERYQRYCKAQTIRDALRLGAKASDIAWDLSRGFARLSGAAQAQVPAAPAAKPATKTAAKADKTAKAASGAARGVKRLRAASPSKEKRTHAGKKMLTADGRTALDRKHTDKAAWEARRKAEEPPPGGWPKPPAHWPPGVRVDLGKPVYWLPDGWGQGVKTTCVAKLIAFVSPEGKCYYHRHVVEQVCGENLGRPKDDTAALEWARKRATMVVTEGKNFLRRLPTFLPEEQLFAKLTPAERARLPKSAADLHFAVVSARRANDEKGIRLIVNVQALLTASGAKPVWYVDAPSLQDYKALGLNAKVGGKLVPARNLALEDAKRLKKPCVQLSDDVTRWDYFVGDMGRAKGLHAGNEAAKNAERLKISPGAAARFLVAKMRADPDGPKLAGVFPLGNTGQAFTREAVSKEHFILGDFFVTEGSPCRFETRMTLKEDYDYTCSHLAKHGAVLRCNRMFIAAVHETNAGGACSERDAQGNKERENIKILQEKWPGVFHLNGNRGDTQVIMSWRRRKF